MDESQSVKLKPASYKLYNTDVCKCRKEVGMDTQKINLVSGWKFHYGECEEAWYKGYDDSGADWKDVTIPHDWSVTMPFSKDYSSGTGYLAGGIGWYRVRFTLPENLRGKNIRICFDGVYKNSMVWCNSYYLGKRPNGYVPFSYDITDMAVFGGEVNVICVKVIHTDIADSRWFTGSGITRKVTVTADEIVHPAEYGIIFRTEKLSENRDAAQLSVSHKMEITGAHSCKNALDKLIGKKVFIESRFYDDKGENVLTLKDETRIKKDENTRVWLSGTFKNPLLCSAESPNLYRMDSYYMVEDTTEKYLVDSRYVGIRTIVFDPNEGFFVNGESVKLKGVCVHHDGGCLGAAMRQEVWQRRLNTLKEAGCNAIRCSHNPHMPELYDLCDHMGFFMMDEAFDEWENPKNKWSKGHNVYPPKHQGYYEDFHMWHEADLEAMVRRDRNHPSVIMYSIGNEVDYPNDPYCHPMFDTMTGNNDANKPEAERRYDSNKPNMERLSVLAKELADIVKKNDPTRPVTVAAAFPELSTHIGFVDELSVVGYNYKEHLYEEDHKRFPDKTFLGSENGHGYRQWRAVTDNDYICGQFLWTGIDYLGEAHGWPVDGSTAGILTTAGLKKPGFLRRKTFWSDEPTLCILTRRVSDGEDAWLPMSNAWDYENEEEILVKIYVTDLGDGQNGILTLYLNDKKIAESSERDDDNAYEFRIPFEKGRLWAEYSESGEEIFNVLSGELMTPEYFDHLSIEIWKDDDLVSGERFAEASMHTGYLYQIYVSAEDKNDVPLRSAVSAKEFFTGRDKIKDPSCEADYEEPGFMADFPDISVSVDGDGMLAGIDSGNLADPSSLTGNNRKLWNGEAVVYVRRTGNGSIDVKINGQRISF